MKRILLALFFFLLFSPFVLAQDFTITCDKETYYCLKNCEAICNITNNLNNAIRVNVSAIFDNLNIEPKAIYWRDTELQNVLVNDYDNVTYYYSCDEVTDYGNGTVTCNSTTLEYFYTFENPEGYNTTHVWQNLTTKVGTHYEQVYNYVWRDFDKKWIILTPRTIKGEREHQASSSKLIKIKFEAPINSFGKFDIEVRNSELLGYLDPYWNSTFPYRRRYYINNTGSELTDFQMAINITNTTNMNTTDYHDLRWTWYNETSLEEEEIPFKLINYTSSYVFLAVKIPKIYGNQNTTLYLYYGNDNVEQPSWTEDNVFVFGDDFNNLNLNITKWNVINNNTGVIIENGVLKMAAWDRVHSFYTLDQKLILLVKTKTNTVNTYTEQPAFNISGGGTIGVQRVYNQQTYFSARETNSAGGTVWSSLLCPHENTFKFIKIIKKSDSALEFYCEGEFKAARTISGNITGADIRFGVTDSGSIAEHDWVYVMKYAEPYPNVIEGEEETAPSISITFNYNSVNFGALNHSTSDNPAPNQLSGVYNVSITSSNPYEVIAAGSNFTDGNGHSFSISNLKMNTNSTSSDLNLNNAISLSETNQVVETNIPTSTTIHYHGYWLTIPNKQYASSYNTTITITYSVV